VNGGVMRDPDGGSRGAADIVVVGGRVFRGTMPGQPAPPGSETGPRPPGAPTAVAVSGGRIVFVGDDTAALREWRGPRTRVLDARGGLVMAGFEDAHLHLLSGAQSLDRIDLFGLESLDEILEAIRRGAAARPGAPWVLGRGWFYSPFPGALPTRQLLDAVVPDRPAYLGCYDGHTGWANSRALALAGIDAATPDPPLGEIVRNPATGEPAGALKEAAADLVLAVVPSPARDEQRAAVRRAAAAMHAAGITAVQDAWSEPEAFELTQTMAEAGELQLRVRLAPPMKPGGTIAEWHRRLDDYEALAAALAGGPWLCSGILKAMADGVVESHTAALLAPYADEASTCGSPTWEDADLAAHVAAASGRGWQLEIHAIGDRAVRSTLDAFEQSGDAGPRRHRVEHIETIDPADIGRFGQLGVVASMQPFHADPSPGQIPVWADALGPERAGRGWAWTSILGGGGALAFGSDWPVVPFDPFIAVHGAVTRQTPGGEPPGGWLPSERLPLPAALSACTLGSAWAAHAEARRGTIAAGLDADLVILDRDFLAEGPTAIIGTATIATIVGGRIVHEGKGAG
jgi:predicted amidohydrolase YtcJ